MDSRDASFCDTVKSLNFTTDFLYSSAFVSNQELQLIRVRSFRAVDAFKPTGDPKPFRVDGCHCQPTSSFTRKIETLLNHSSILSNELWNFVKQKYIISEDGKPWVMRTISDAWRVYKSFIKKIITRLMITIMIRGKTDQTFYRTKNLRSSSNFGMMPNRDFQKLAAKNSTNRKLIIKDQHTCGPIGFARIRKKLQLEKPDQVEPSKVELFVATRKKNEGHQYKDDDNSTAD
ncbi:uncharacterized protein [Euphorbia lathyris]|uniref:uncharacterized protein n=1 Tax=Euphorbia lathyris TaxID=212925 RepID=UPI003313C5D1